MSVAEAREIIRGMVRRRSLSPSQGDGFLADLSRAPRRADEIVRLARGYAS